MKRALTVLACLLSPLTAGCDRVGAPLIDRVPPADPPPLTIDCVLPAECEPLAQEPELQPRMDVLPIDLRTCGARRLGACTPQTEMDALGVEASDADADAGIEAAAEPEPCTTDLDTDALLALEGATLHCQALELTVDGGEHRVSDLTLRSVNLRIRAARPTSVTLEGATLEAVFIELEGPITLRVQHAREVEVLRVVAAAGTEGQPQLELLDVLATGLATGTLAAPFAGVLRLDQVELGDVQLHAERVELQSAALTGARVEAQAMTATDAQLSYTTLALGDALLSAFTLSNSIVESCDTLVLIAGRITRSVLGPCTGPPVRVYDTKVVVSRADGRFESDEATWERVALGVSAPTELVAFGGRLRALNFCHEATRPLLGGGLALSCSRCDGWDASSAPACRIDGSPVAGTHANYCPRLDPSAYESCPAPVPERNRPLDHPF